jgi:hypothetical protein
MKSLLIAAVLAIATPGLATAAPAYVGIWDCEMAMVVITTKTYSAGGSKPGKIKEVERFKNDYRIELTDGYAVSLFNVTKKTMTWHSLSSGDTYDCRRKK